MIKNYSIGKRILSVLAIATTFATVASADFARVEMGAGAWMQTPSGLLSYTDSSGTSLKDISQETKQTEGYAWLLIKHPIPILPNIRLEYVDTLNIGKFSVAYNGFSSAEAGSSKLKMTQYDVVPYYNILDNTGWMTLDLGLDVKVIQLNYTADATLIQATTAKMLAIPLGYVRARVQAPFMNWGVEADIKYLSYGGNTVSDKRVKVDYTFGAFPIIQPAIEIGYRVQKFDLSNGGYAVNLEYKGVYAGLMLRF